MAYAERGDGALREALVKISGRVPVFSTVSTEYLIILLQ